MMQINSRLLDYKKLRMAAFGMTGKELAEKTGLSVNTVHRALYGKGPFRLGTLERIARAVGVEAEELMVWEDTV